MVKNRKTEQIGERDFVSSAAFQKAFRKTKWKQISLYIIISVLTVCAIIFFLQAGSKALINKKFEQEMERLTEQIHGTPGKGAGIVDLDASISYGFLSAEGKFTYYKKMGDRLIPWEIVTKEYPAIGDVKQTNPTRVEVFYTSKLERTVRYNHLNNEREIDFYYPHIGYHQLPNELEIATGLDENTLIEVALSFVRPMKQEELGEIIGGENVEWLWIDKSNAEHFNELHYSESDFFHVMHGDDAYGLPVSEDSPYWENNDSTIEIPGVESTNTEYLISGAIVSGTPSELKRFKEIDIIRASVIGLTIDKY
ncbi:anti sigma factor C-terminal domain-containing protein [Ornithinibacillus xuwenensis]|uniref:Anti sigma factor C-terminal domain-containing protein n=1 Tax=Ornithinibacillus xuwenensis TaxID=3144668 RepID=A0ABU9XKM1_9BACI